MKLKKLTIAFIAAISLIGTFSFNNEETQAASINTEAKKYKYSGVTYLYKMLKLEGIKYNKFPGVEYQMVSQKASLFTKLTIRVLPPTMRLFTSTASG